MAGLLPTPDQDELRALVRTLVADHVDGRRAAIDAGRDVDAWRALVEQVGLVGLVVPEAHGGSGLGWADLAVAMEELGAGLLPVPALSSALAVAALLQVSGGSEADALLEQVVAGERRAVLVQAHGPEPVCVAAAGPAVRLERAPVLEAGGADVVLVPADSSDGVLLHAIDAKEATVATTANLDLTRPVGLVDIAATDAQPIGRVDLVTLHDVGRFLVAAEQVGGARATLAMAVDWAKERQQFDRPIGSFQAIKHQLADAFVNVEAAVAALAEASRLVADRGEAFARAAAVAKSMAGDAFHDNAELNIHVHGGVGFTWEHDAHLYLRRAVADNALFGHPRSLDAGEGRRLTR